MVRSQKRANHLCRHGAASKDARMRRPRGKQANSRERVRSEQRGETRHIRCDVSTQAPRRIACARRSAKQRPERNSQKGCDAKAVLAIVVRETTRHLTLRAACTLERGHYFFKQRPCTSETQPRRMCSGAWYRCGNSPIHQSTREGVLTWPTRTRKLHASCMESAAGPRPAGSSKSPGSLTLCGSSSESSAPSVRRTQGGGETSTRA